MNAVKTRSRDKVLLLSLTGAALLLCLLVSVLAPTAAKEDPRPSTYNTGPAGAKAVYLTLAQMGTPVDRWTEPLVGLDREPAADTTLLLLEPQYTALERGRLTAEIGRFLDRGGRVLTTGAAGALLLPGGGTAPGHRFGAGCITEPNGPGPLAAAGAVRMDDGAVWRGAAWVGSAVRSSGKPASQEPPVVFTEQRCGADALVVRMPVGGGEAVWWSSASPLTNARLLRGNDLPLLLASVGPGRRVLFDEALQEAVPSKWSAVVGLPLWWLLGQATLVFALLVFSFSRRRGPVRLPVALPRSSPVEFAVNMGDLYERAGATEAATEAARRRLERVLVVEAGLGEPTVRGGPEVVMAALAARFGGTWAEVGEHLREAAAARGLQLKGGSALKLVRALAGDGERVRRAARPPHGRARRSESESDAPQSEPGATASAKGTARELLR